MSYSKKQTGWIIIIAMIILLVLTGMFYGLAPSSEEINMSALITLIITLSAILLFFYQLRINISNSKIQLVYGIGLIRFNFKVDKLISAEATKTPWYLGLGIRFSTNGMIYNINTLKAVRVQIIQNGKQKSFFIGTPNPEELKAKIEEFCSK
jgi:hypothetical protein